MLSRYTRAKYRVKIKSLAEEARIIRAEEARALRPFRLSRLQRRVMRTGIVDFALPKAKVEALTAEIAKTGDNRIMTATGLRLHRIGILRDEARATQLAYAFARGVPYGVCEKTSKRLDVKRVFEIVRSMVGYGDHLKVEITPASITDWAVTTDPVLHEQTA